MIPRIALTQTRQKQRESQRPGIAYLIGKYPAISHTFILREVAGLRELGMRIETVSINAPDRPVEMLTPAERGEQQRTFYMKYPGCIPRHAGTLLRLLVTRPGVVARGVAAWASYGDWDVRLRMVSIFYVAEALLIGDWMQKKKLDHLHSHFGGAVAVVAMFMAQAFRKTFSFTIHGPDEYMDLRTLRVKQKSEAAKFVVTISEFGRVHLLRILGMAARDHVNTVRLGVDLHEFRPAARNRVTGAPVHLVCVGRLVKEKAQDVLLEAVARVVRQGWDVRLTLVGDGPAAERFKRLAQQLELGGRVKFTGALPQPQTLEILRSAEMFVLPSFAEGIPVALMEAMAMEIPCVSTRVMGIPELITDGEDGLLVQPADVEALAGAIVRLTADRELRLRVGRAAREKVAEQFNLKNNVPLLQQTFARHLGNAVAQGTVALQANTAKVVAA